MLDFFKTLNRFFLNRAYFFMINIKKLENKHKLITDLSKRFHIYFLRFFIKYQYETEEW